ncbi:MAG: hypothetical protein AAF628_24655 [Planctomycetota bacterium]
MNRNCFPQLALGIALCAATVCAQEAPPKRRAALLTPAPKANLSQAELVALRAEKLAKPVFSNAAWHFDFDKARATARAEDKFLLVYFTRSYAP